MTYFVPLSLVDPWHTFLREIGRKLGHHPVFGNGRRLFVQFKNILASRLADSQVHLCWYFRLKVPFWACHAANVTYSHKQCLIFQNGERFQGHVPATSFGTLEDDL